MPLDSRPRSSQPPSFLTALLFLSLILPSWAQVTTPTPIASTAASSSTSLSSPTPTNTDDGGAGSTPFNVNTHAFNYYFLIVAIAAVIVCSVVLYYGRMRKLKAAQHRAARYDAAAAEADTRWRERLRAGRRIRPGSRPSNEIPEGLNERGEAPPPYKSRPSRPPSIGQGEGAAALNGTEDMELGRVNVSEQEPRPPGYQSAASENVPGNEVTRPPAAVTATNRSESVGDH